MVIVRICGGLGNQLFCYAAARRLSLSNEKELILDNISGFKFDQKYKRDYQLDNFNITCKKATNTQLLRPFSRIRRYLRRRINLRRPFEKRNYIQQEGVDFDSRLLTIRPRGAVYLDGYWQSELYFKDIEATIRNDLQIKPPLDAVNMEVAQQINACQSVAVHVRFFDQFEEGGVNNAPTDYYTRALGKMEKLIPNAHYFIFSDQPDVARNRIPLPNERITLVSNNQGDENAYADLWLMTQCQHFIIANSTFSWWGAWLGNSPDKVVIAPGFELREGVAWWGFKGLIPDEWIKC